MSDHNEGAPSSSTSSNSGVSVRSSTEATLQTEPWTTIIEPKTGIFSVRISELWHYRDLVGLLVRRDIQTVYKQTVLGPLWFIIQPVITTVIYTFVFNRMAGLSTSGIPAILFYFSGTMLWHYFQACLSNVSDTFVSNAALFGKVYFPRLVIPISKVISNLVSLGIQIASLIVIYAYFMIIGQIGLPGFQILFLPIIIAWLAILASGFGMVISALTTKYRDLRQLLAFGLQLWMYATPIVYPLAQIPANLRWVAYINPVTAPIELSRAVIFGTSLPDSGIVLTSVVSTVVIFLFGMILFHRNENTFIDVV